MSACLRCRGQAHTAFLCRNCTSRVRRSLRGLPRLLRHLREAAVGQTRLGDIGRRVPYRRRFELNGDSELASHIEPLTPRDRYDDPVTYVDDDDPDPRQDAGDLYQSRRARQQSALRKLLAAGGVNERAYTLYDDTINTLITWIRDICETRGATPDIDDTDPAALCGWLTRHIDTIANHEAADEFCDELDHRIRDILRVINRPIPQQYCGPCPANVVTDDGKGGVCNRELTTRRGAAEVQCPACKTVHNVEQLCRDWLETSDESSFTISQLSGMILPAMREYVPLRTLQHWAATGKLVPTGYDRNGDPRFQLADVRELRDRKPQTRPTGACARAK